MIRFCLTFNKMDHILIYSNMSMKANFTNLIELNEFFKKEKLV
jgi:hypothetical protein